MAERMLRAGAAPYSRLPSGYCTLSIEPQSAHVQFCNSHRVELVPFPPVASCTFRPHHAGEQQAAAATLNCMTSMLGYRPCVQFAIAALADVH